MREAADEAGEKAADEAVASHTPIIIGDNARRRASA
jgi:hypothetical protein